MNIKRTFSRFAVALTLAAGSAAAYAQSLTPVKFTMDWRIEGPSVLFLLPLYKGYFKDEGLDVTMDIGTGSAAAVTRIVSGAYDMGSGDMSALIEYMGNNPGTPPLQAVYQIYDNAPGAVFYWKKTGIKSPRDLAGKKLAASAFDAVYRTFPLIESTNQLPPNSVNWVMGDPQMKELLMMRGDADGLTAFFATGLLNLKSRGAREEDIGWFKFGDLGINNMYGNAVLASSKLIKENPRVVAAFLRAFNRGFKEVVANPKEAIQYAKRREPMIDEKLELERLRLALQDIATPAARAAGFGGIQAQKLEAQTRFVASAFKLKTTPEAAALFNTGFLPPAAERMPAAQ